jgi:hypothetical protein
MYAARVDKVLSILIIYSPFAGCCIYAKPHKFGESDSESDSDGDDDCCHEHRVARRRVPHKQSQPQDQPSEKSS